MAASVIGGTVADALGERRLGRMDYFPIEPRKGGRKRTRFAVCLNCGNDAGRKNNKYCSNQCQNDYQWKVTKAEIDRTGGVSVGTSGQSRNAKRYLLETRGRSCQICGGKEWQGQPIPLILDHVDGNPANWTVTNLRFVCPNCDAQLPTFKNRNRGKGRAARRGRYAAGLSY